MKRYLCILFLLFGYFIFRGDCVLASGVARLVKVVYYGASDFSTAYAYDANGNMTKDLNRGIESITYDWNNMPREITFTSGAKTRYTYDAAGRKLRAEYITPLAASANYATRSDSSNRSSVDTLRFIYCRLSRRLRASQWHARAHSHADRLH